MGNKFKKLGLNVIGILGLYALCFIYGGHIDRNAPAALSELRYGDVITEMARMHNVNAALVAAVIQAESNFNPNATSGAGARGLMQITGSTQKYLRLKNVYDPKQNIEAGSRYLRELLNTFKGDLSKAIAAYNAGPGAVKRYAGIPPYKETRDYVKRVLTYFKLYKKTIFTDTLMS